MIVFIFVSCEIGYERKFSKSQRSTILKHKIHSIFDNNSNLSQMTKVQNPNNQNRFIYSSNDTSKSSLSTISLMSSDANGVFSEKWNLETTKNVTFFNDFDLPVSFFPINSIKQILQNLKINESHFKAKNMLENKLKTLLSKDFRDCSLYSLGVCTFSNGFLRFLVICCSKGVIITDTSLIGNNKYYNDMNSNNDVNDSIHDFLRFISNSAEIVGTNFTTSLPIIESLYQVKIGIRNIDIIDSFINFLRSAESGPNWKTIYTHQVHDYPVFENSFNANSLFSILDVISIAHRTVASYFYSTNVCEDSAVFIARIPITNSSKYTTNDFKNSIFDKGQSKITIERPDKGFSMKNNNDNMSDQVSKENSNIHEMARLPFTLPVSPISSDPTSQQIQKPLLTLIPGKNMHKSSDSGVKKSGNENAKSGSSDLLHPAPFSLLPNATSHSQQQTLSLLPSETSSHQKKQQSQQNQSNQAPLTNLMLLPKSKSIKHASPSTNAVLSKNTTNLSSNAHQQSSSSNASANNSSSDDLKSASKSSSSKPADSECKQTDKSVNLSSTSNENKHDETSSESTKSVNFSSTTASSDSLTNQTNSAPIKIQTQKEPVPKLTVTKKQESYMMAPKMSPRRGSQSPPRVFLSGKEDVQQQQKANQAEQEQTKANNKSDNNTASSTNNYNSKSNNTNYGYQNNNYNRNNNYNNRNTNFAYNGNRNNRNNNFAYNNNNNYSYNKNSNFVYNNGDNNSNPAYNNKSNNNFVYSYNGDNNNSNKSNNFNGYNGNSKNRNNSFNEKFHYRSPSADSENQQNKINNDNQNANYNSSSSYYNTNKRFGSNNSNNRFFYSKSNDTEANASNKSSESIQSNEQKEKVQTETEQREETVANESQSNIEETSSKSDTENKEKVDNQTKKSEPEPEPEIYDKSEAEAEMNKKVLIENNDENQKEIEKSNDDEKTKEKQNESEEKGEETNKNTNYTIVNDEFWNKLRFIEATLASESVIQTDKDGFKCKQCDVVVKSFSELMQHCWECHSDIINNFC